MTKTTTILGVTYRGRPQMNSTAFRVWSYEQDGQHAKAQQYLRAMRMMGPVDLQADMTEIPMEGMQAYPAFPCEKFEWIDREDGSSRVAA